MIYVLFWYIVIVTVLSTCAGSYNVAKSVKSFGEKVSENIGLSFRLVTYLYFLYSIYPVLQFVKQEDFMYSVEQLYVVYEDDRGHKHLIPKSEYGKFDKALTRIGESYKEHKNEYIYCDDLSDLLDAFSDQTLEGELYYVVLEEHVKEI